jgi:hypothetical protein
MGKYKEEFMKIEPVKSMTILDHDETLYMSPWGTADLDAMLHELEIPYKKAWKGHKHGIPNEIKQNMANIWFPRMREFGLGFDNDTDINSKNAVNNICSYTLPLSWQDVFKLSKTIDIAYADKTSEFAKIFFAMDKHNYGIVYMN